MSPEQIEGKEADGRSDIFSFGAVLYEMLTGKRAFEGKSRLSVASAILEKEPEPTSEVKPMTPPALDHTIRRCLAKVPDERWQSAADIKHELDWIAKNPLDTSSGFALQQRKRGSLRARALLLGGIGILVVAVLAVYLRSDRGTPSSPVIRATLLPVPNVTVLTLGDQAGSPALSHDGTQLVFAGIADGKQMLFLRAMDSATAKSLAGSEGGKFPFWSPDGKSIGFFADHQLKRLELAGGPPTALARAPDGRGGTWAGDTILFSPYIYESIYRVPAKGGTPVRATTIDNSQHTTHRWPHFLPDSKHFLYLAANHLTGKGEKSGIYAGSIDGGTAKLVQRANGSAFYASGELLYYRDGSLMAQGFDAARLETSGEAHLVGPVLRESGNFGVVATASDNGLLLFQSPGEVKFGMSWFDRKGKALGPAPISGELFDLRLSPDHKRAVVVRFEGAFGNVFVSDLKNGTPNRLSFGEDAWFAVWSPEGTKIAYSAQVLNKEVTNLYMKRIDGAGDSELLLSSENINHPSDWTRDGKYLVFSRGPLGAQRIWVLPMFGDRKPFPLFPSATYDHSEGRVSPDGKWIAYTSAEAGASEVYITSFPDGKGKWQVSSGGNIPAAIWRDDGTELYFATLDGNLMVASIREGNGSISVENVHPLFRSPFTAGLVHMVFDVDAKGQRFIGSVAPNTDSLPLNVITNWTAELEKK
jgi:eukaryotic-like serine/threonine-protein kinase